METGSARGLVGRRVALVFGLGLAGDSGDSGERDGVPAVSSSEIGSPSSKPFNLVVGKKDREVRLFLRFSKLFIPSTNMYE